jgi:peptide-methionine (R)-S-oxide reductase
MDPQLSTADLKRKRSDSNGQELSPASDFVSCLRSRSSLELQKQSICELPVRKKFALYEDITLEDRRNYFRVSTFPITKQAEDDMEMISDLITWGELYKHESRPGVFCCAQCLTALYHSADKWDGPCVWPSFRSGISEEYGEPHGEDALNMNISSSPLLLVEVSSYNNYTVTVMEIYCNRCKLFIGHAFEDGVAKGDKHPLARWRH